MKIKDYERITKAKNSDVFLLARLDDADAGVYTISYENLMSESGDENGGNVPSGPDDIYELLDESFTSAKQRRGIYRGMNLGTFVTSEQRAAIANGSFKGLFLGDYWKINNVTWRIVDFDYWYNAYDSASSYCTTHHVVIMPDKALLDSPMYDTDTTSGGYVGATKLHEALEQIRNRIFNAFEGFQNILHFNEWYIKKVVDGVATMGQWYVDYLTLPNEPMIYGHYVYTPLDGVGRETIDTTQLAAIRLNPDLICINKENYWLRDVVNDSRFSYVRGSVGITRKYTAGSSMGVRPVFGFIGEPISQ